MIRSEHSRGQLLRAGHGSRLPRPPVTVPLVHTDSQYTQCHKSSGGRQGLVVGTRKRARKVEQGAAPHNLPETVRRTGGGAMAPKIRNNRQINRIVAP